MLSPNASEVALRRLFGRQPVTELSTLMRVLETRSRMSVFRRLKVDSVARTPVGRKRPIAK